MPARLFGRGGGVFRKEPLGGRPGWLQRPAGSSFHPPRGQVSTCAHGIVAYSECLAILEHQGEGTEGKNRTEGAPDNLSYILRIGRALLFGFIRSLLQQIAEDHPQRALVEQLSGEDALMEQLANEDVSDSAQVTSLQEFMLHLWRELSNNPEITSMVQCVTGNNPLKVLAEVSETMFASGINWGRIVVFFYFAYRVIVQSSSSWFHSVLDWAMAFLQDHLAAWIQQQGGWIAMLNYTISPVGRGRPMNTLRSTD